MAFALTIIKLEEAMKKGGCPVCRMEYEAALQSIDSFLWENVNEPDVRKPINDAYGFCPEHTRMLVSKEIMASGYALGVNIIYELLAKNASREIRRKGHGGSLRRRLYVGLKKFGIDLPGLQQHTLLQPHGECPVCVMVRQSGDNILSVLCEELEAGSGKIRENLQQSDGLCLRHVRQGVEKFEGEYPAAIRLLVEDTVGRLDAQRELMESYIEKHNWSRKGERLTPEESSAWLQTLTFFTGLPRDRFSHHIDEF